MKKLLFLLFTFFYFFSFSQKTIKDYIGKIYIFDAYEQGNKCDYIGQNKKDSPIVFLKGSIFTVERILDGKSVVIKFINWKKDSTNRVTYNFKSPQDKTPFFFSLDSTTFANSCSEYTYVGNWDITFGTFTTPFKFRHNPLLFTNNLNLGTSICFQVKKGPNWSLGFVGGLSLSSITLDNFSTKGAVPSSTERPAVTPSLNLMIGYKNINLMFGLGWDYINKTSPLEESWIYNGKHWVGVGVGISLFNSNPATASTVKAEGQKTP